MDALRPLQDNAVDVVNRLRHVLQHINADRKCQTCLTGALDRFAALEERRLSHRQLGEARDQRDRIAAILSLLSELDELTEGERDRTVFREMELLFCEVANCAAAGAAALRRIPAE